MSVRWPWLAQPQGNELYKQATGYLLLGYMLAQWRLSRARSADCKGAIMAQQLKRHKNYGAFAPVVLFTHAISLGYAYQIVLAAAFLGACAIGLVNTEITRTTRPVLYNAWLGAHVLCAASALLLAGYHIYVIYNYSCSGRRLK